MVSLREGREVENSPQRGERGNHQTNTWNTERERNTKRTNFSHHRHFNAQNTFTHTPRQKKVRFSFRARAIVSIARIRARIRDDAFAFVVLDPAHYSRGAVSLFLSFFCGLSAFSRFLNLRCHDARVKEEEEENRTRERGRREKDDLNLEIKRMIHRAMREIRARGGRFLGRELCLFLFFDDF